jgi:hypothetical protein
MTARNIDIALLSVNGNCLHFKQTIRHGEINSSSSNELPMQACYDLSK